MKTVNEILTESQHQREQRDELKQNKQFEGGLFHGLKLALAQMLGTVMKFAKQQTFKVNVENQIKMPDTQKVEGQVSLNEMWVLILGLSEVIKRLESVATTIEQSPKNVTHHFKPEQVDLKPLEAAIKGLKLNVAMPEQKDTVTVTNLAELKKPLADLASKLQIKFPDIHIPEYPKSVTVGNLTTIEKLLVALSNKEQPVEEQPLGFSWKRDSNGKLETLTEIYPSGKVISTGWNLGAVQVDDQRNR